VRVRDLVIVTRVRIMVIVNLVRVRVIVVSWVYDSKFSGKVKTIGTIPKFSEISVSKIWYGTDFKKKSIFSKNV